MGGAHPPTGPAARAAARISRAELLLGALGLASIAFVVTRFAERWHVAPAAASHQLSLFGQQFSYPTANAAAVVILALAVFCLAVTAIVVVGVAQELALSLHFRRRMGATALQQFRGAPVFQDERPRAFCAGLLKPQVYISSGAVTALDEAAVNAVLLHERHHAHRYDPLRLATGRVLTRALFFLPGLRQLVAQERALSELSADESAISASAENRAALARSMLSFSDHPVAGEAAGIDPARVDQLLGEPPRLRFPAALCLAGASVLALIVAIGVLAGQVADGSATLAPPFFSSRPCVVVLAMIPASLGLIARRFAQRQWAGPQLSPP
jgi:hypothetical protein